MEIIQQYNMNLSREETLKLIEKGKQYNLTGKQVIDGLVLRGYKPEGVNVDAIKQTIPVEQKRTTLGQDLKQSLDTRVERTGDILNREDSSLMEKGTQLFGQGAGFASDVIEKSISKIPVVKQALEGMGKGIQWLSQTAPIKALGEKIGESKALQEAVSLYDTDENFRDSVDAVANIVRLGGDIALAEQATNFTKNVTNKLLDKTKTPVMLDGGAGSSLPDEILSEGLKLKDRVQLSIAKKNVSPQLESSANRLFLKGTKKLENPVATYDKYLTQSKKAIGDIKADPAISVVGEKMGKAFETVIKQRKNVGEVLGSELKKVGNTKINVSDAKNNLLAELKDSGLSYNPKTKQLTSFQGSKFAPEEVSMLDDFLKGVNSLGDNPSVSQIDNFISKTRTALQFTKGKSGIMGTTNAERIINGQISRLRSSLNPEINGNKALSKYWDANKTYSELSDFVEEGSGFLGKKTLSGDFAKDASVAKSSVQSILNQGKKDFMIKLEALTGYNAIDDAVLALQAMKDAGDFRGLSLLQAMSETGIPTSKTGITQKILDYATSKGGELLAGTPEQQTRAILQDVSKNIINKTSISPSVSKKSLKGNGTIPENSLISEAKKYKSAEDFVRKVMNESNISQHGKFETIPLNKIKGSDYIELDSALAKNKKLTLDQANNILPDNEMMSINGKVSMPIEVIKNSDGTYSLQAGNHRVAQQLINGEKTIFANIQNEKGFSTKSQLEEIWKQANNK